MAQSKTLIIYFSLSGNTKRAAEQLQRKLGADLYRLEPVQPYPQDYQEIITVGEAEKDHDRHPAIKQDWPDLSQYDEIAVGYPIWWGQPPMIIHSSFEQADFKGKTIMPFATSSSTPLSATLTVMRQLTRTAGATLTLDNLSSGGRC